MGAILTPGVVYFDGLKFITISVPGASDATNSQKGILKLSGDFGGTANSPLVIGIQGNSVSNAPPTSGQVLSWNGSTWIPTTISASVSDATSSQKGILKLSGDLGGTADSPSVAKINGTSVVASPSANTVLIASSGTTSSWSTIVNANISNSAAISGSKINPNFGTQALITGTATITTLSNPAQSGDIRASNNTTILTARNTTNNGDIPIIATDNTNAVFIGDNTITGDVAILSSSSVSLESLNWDITVDNTIGLITDAPNIQFTTRITSPTIYQDDSSGPTQDLTVRAQNSVGVSSTGGSLVLQSGAGTSTNGSVKFSSGSTVLGAMTLGTSTTWALTADAGANGIRLIANGNSNIVNLQATGTSGTIALDTASSINFRDSGSATAFSVTPNSSGTTTLQFASGVTPIIKQADLGFGFTGSSLTIQAQNATGGGSFGGSLILQSGTGTNPNGNGNITFKSGSTTLGSMSLASSAWSIGNSIGMTLSTTGASTSIKLQAVAASGTILLDANSSINFRDAGSATAISITPNSMGTTTLQFATGVTAANINQADKTANSGTGANLTIQAQNETGTTSIGGDLILSPGTGTSTNGNINLNNLSTTTTAPSAGAGDALPLTPAGYVSVKINGTIRQLAFY